MKISKAESRIDIKSCLIGALAVLLLLVVLNMHSLNAGPQNQQTRPEEVHAVVRSLTVVNADGTPVFQISADSTGSGVFVMRNSGNVPQVLMRSVRDGDTESGMVYCNGVGIWGPRGKVSTIVNASAIQFLNQ